MRSLVRVRLPIKENDSRINSRRSYLAKIEKNWYAGTFTRYEYGWNFNAVYDAGFQLDWDGWEELYEIQ